jgi:hypothetical protein
MVLINIVKNRTLTGMPCRRSQSSELPDFTAGVKENFYKGNSNVLFVR